MNRIHNTPTDKPDQSIFALLVIDVQQGLFKKSAPIYMADRLLENINALANRAHQDGAPVFFIQHSDQKYLLKGSQDWQLHPRLQPLPGDCTMHKQHGDAFEGTILGEELQAREINSLVVTGLVTHGCVRATCLGAKERGYRVILVKDGHSNYSKKAAALIEEWNGKLEDDGIEVKPAAEVAFC